jgi:hypothetical protein
MRGSNITRSRPMMRRSVVQVGVHLLDRVDQVGQAFERVVLALHRDDHAVRRAQAVQGQHRQRRRAVDQDEIVVGIDLGQRVLQAALAVVQLHHLDFGAGQLAIRGQHVEAPASRWRASGTSASPSSTW